MSDEQCGGFSEEGDEYPDIVQVGPPYNPAISGDPLPPANLQMLLALIDKRRWPLHNCGDTSTGVNATPWGFMDVNINRYEPIDGPDPIPQYPLHPPTYPGVGVTAYGCEIDCNYLITGPLGAEGIIGKIDGQWHILRVTGSANTAPLTGPSNECRCCGGSRKNRIMRAEILSASGDNCSYPVKTQFLLNPVTPDSELNPLQLSISCEPRPESAFEDIEDWTAFACGVEAEIIRLDCCAPIVSYDYDTGYDLDYDGYDCRFEAVIRTTPVEECEDCSYDILIWDEPGEPCEKFADQPYGMPVVMEACGLPELDPGTRVIMARIPGGLSAYGYDTSSGDNYEYDQEIVEWFVVRACTPADCANPCDVDPPIGPLCCGKRCSEMPETVSVSIEVLEGDFECDPPAGVTLVRTATTSCDGASDTRWSLPAEIPDNTLCTGVTPDPPNFPTWLDIEDMLLVCPISEESCGDPETYEDGPEFNLQMRGGLIAGLVNATPNLTASCCDPFYLEFEIEGQFWMVAGAGVIDHNVKLKLVVTA
jgi:hypothetical protein